MKTIQLSNIESDDFYKLSSFEEEYSSLKEKFLKILGYKRNEIKFPQGIITLKCDLNMNGSYINITSGTKEDMKEWIRKYKEKNFKLVIKSNTWQLKGKGA